LGLVPTALYTKIPLLHQRSPRCIGTSETKIIQCSFSKSLESTMFYMGFACI
jgi:hypothetical protein